MDNKVISISDLKKVRGIGEKTIKEAIKQIEKVDDAHKDVERVKAIIPPKNMELELNDIYCGESVEMMRRHIPDNTIDLTITSPPYDNLRKYDGFDFNYEAMLEELYRVTKDGGVVVWVVGDSTLDGSESGTSFKQALYAKSIGFNLHDTMIYAKNNPMPLTHSRYEQQFEYMFVFSKGSPITFNPKMIETKTSGTTYDYSKRVSASSTTESGSGRKRNEVVVTKPLKQDYNIWYYNIGVNQSTKDKNAFQHPAIFPEQLAEDHILSWSNEGDVVFDPMCGSGTTCKMAKLNNRKYIGFDVSDKYCEIAKARIENTFK